MTMRVLLPVVCSLMLTMGCSSGKAPPTLSSQSELKPNVGEFVRIDGTAHWMQIAGPSIAGDDFEIRVYPRNVWGHDMDGTRVEVSGRLNDSAHATPPDPSFTPGEYWLSETKWKRAEPAKK